MLRKISYGILFGMGLIIAACGNRGELNGEKLPKVKDKVLKETLDSLSDQSFDYFYAKLGSKYQDSSQKYSFKTSVRMVSDSALNALITFAKIPIFNSLITKDSVKVTNKRKKCYILRDLNYMKATFGTEFTHRNLEELFLGWPLGYDKKLEYYRLKDPYHYKMCTHSAKMIERMTPEDAELIVSYELSKDAKQLEKAIITSLADSTEILLTYNGRQLVNGYQIPVEMLLNIRTPKGDVNMEMTYKKVRINEKEEIHFVIPDSYEACP